MAKQTFNVIGLQDTVTELLAEVKRLSGSEPTTLTFEKLEHAIDLNIDIDDEYVDAFVDFCDQRGLNYEMV